MNGLRRWFERSKAFPGGTRLFSWAAGQYAPYTGTTGAEIVALEDGKAVVRLRDRRRVRNHLDSIHALALANIGEFSTGLAVLGTVPEGSRMILKTLKIDYHKKARGTLLATGRVDLPTAPGRHEVVGRSEITDGKGQVVTTIEALWVVEIK
jgi:acyl-coenzyme A thioesterase PaaI-like protein